ncbi:MAG: hypothetical protein ACE5DX_05465 [Candidatus Dojkabacteria bacterium]
MSTEPDAQAASEESGTQKPDIKVTSSQDENDASKTVNLSSSDQETQDQNETTEGKQRNLEAEKGKIAALERERNDYSKRLQEAEQQQQTYKQIVDVVNNQFKNDREGYEKFRQASIAAGGTDYGTYDQLYGGSSQQNTTGGQSTDAQASGSLNVDEIVERAKREVREETESQELEGALGAFLDKNPDLDVRNLTPGGVDYQQRMGHLSKVAQLATTFRKIYPELSKEALIERAHRSIDIEGSMQQEREIGKVVGRKEAYATGAGNVGSLSGSKSGDSGADSVELTPEEHSHYEAMMKTSPSAAKKFAERIKAEREG